MSGREELVRRAQAYANRTGRALGKQLGSGVHGIVFAVESQTEPGRAAIKVHERERDYCRERDVYLRLLDHGTTEIRGWVARPSEYLRACHPTVTISAGMH